MHARLSGRPAIGIGYDGSPGSRAALEWAAAEAIRRRADVHAVVCLDAEEPEPAPDVTPLHAAAMRLVELHLEDAALPAVDVIIEIVHGRAADRLLEACRHDSLMAVGVAGHMLLGDWRLGAVAHEVVRHASCPVVLVPARWRARDPDRVVVGIDQSAASRRALDWAIDEAGRRRSELLIVHTWSGNGARSGAALLDEARRTAQVRLDGAVTAELIEGRAEATLLSASLDANLLVIGTAGAGSKSKPPGSIARQVIACATVPTVAVGAGVLVDAV